jgi:hypothetical protein
MSCLNNDKNPKGYDYNDSEEKYVTAPTSKGIKRRRSPEYETCERAHNVQRAQDIV